MRQYDSYKDSGQQWLGEIPSHWEIKRLASYFKERRNKVSDKEYAPLSVTKLGIFPQWENVAKTNDGDNRKLVKAGDFVINSRSDRKGSSGISDRDGSVSLINTVLQLRSNIYPPFCLYLLKSYSFIEEYYRNGHGIVADLWTTGYDEMKMIKLAIPKMEEQKVISYYLDKITAHIDKAIAQQQRMIDLLNERKQIIIQQAVTKGLNPNAKMKNSGVEWIGQVPEHWEVIRLKRCAAVKTGCTPSTKELKYYENQDINWFTPEDIGSERICEAQKKVSYIAKQEGACKVFPSHIVYFVGIGASIGKVSYCDIEASANQQINAIIPNHRVNYKFLSYCLKTQKEEIFLTANTVTLPIINQERTGSLLITVPPLSEQKKIVSYIETKTANIDKAITKQQQIVDLFKERKQIIINDAVTGKIKVI